MRGIAWSSSYIFIGSERGGKSAAIIYTLIETVKQNLAAFGARCLIGVDAVSTGFVVSLLTQVRELFCTTQMTYDEGGTDWFLPLSPARADWVANGFVGFVRQPGLEPQTIVEIKPAETGSVTTMVTDPHLTNVIDTLAARASQTGSGCPDLGQMLRA
jgi:hypothetical protein